jgi:hypothetical protein
VPVISLDAIWEPHWGVKDVPAFRALMKKAHAGNEWISDGNFAVARFDIRLPRATLVIWLERSKVLCALRAVTRVFERGADHRIGRLAEVFALIWHFDRVMEAMRISHAPDVPVRRLTGSATLRTFCRLTMTELPIQF